MKISIVIPNYNNSSLITKCLDALINQKLIGNHTFQITVVDDGSTDNSAGQISATFGDNINLIRLSTNQGRSTARNTGAEQSDADFVIFIDSDCIPANENFIKSYLDILPNAELLFGQVSTKNLGFWDNLQNNTFSNRNAEFNDGQTWAYTTQNVCIRRDLFLKVGGFDTCFDKHGFEDRDLFIRLIKQGARTAYCHTANVIHDDSITLCSVSGKMLAAGLHSSIEFRSKHPAHYQQSVYARLDAVINPKLRFLDLLAWPIANSLAQGKSNWLEWRIIPLALRIAAARLIYGLHYLHGTVLARKKSE